MEGRRRSSARWTLFSRLQLGSGRARLDTCTEAVWRRLREFHFPVIPFIRWWRTPWTVLSEEERQAMAAHQCGCVDRSWLMQRTGALFDWLEQHGVPAGLSPDALTVMGFAAVLCPSLWCGLLAPTLTEPLPPAALFGLGIGVLTHMVLDALDGRRARRQRCTSRFGEYLDHSLDSLVACLSAVNVTATLRIGDRWIGNVPFAVFTSVLYVSVWQSVYSGRLCFAVLSPVTEGAVALALFYWVHALAASMGGRELSLHRWLTQWPASSTRLERPWWVVREAHHLGFTAVWVAGGLWACWASFPPGWRSASAMKNTEAPAARRLRHEPAAATVTVTTLSRLPRLWELWPVLLDLVVSTAFAAMLGDSMPLSALYMAFSALAAYSVLLLQVSHMSGGRPIRMHVMIAGYAPYVLAAACVPLWGRPLAAYVFVVSSVLMWAHLFNTFGRQIARVDEELVNGA